MITDVVIVPGAPLLLPEYQGRVAAAPGLLESCVDVVREAVSSAHHVIVVHATDREPRSSKPAVGGRVADHLLAATHENFDVEHVAVAWDAPVEECVSLGRAIAKDPRLVRRIGDSPSGTGRAEGRDELCAPLGHDPSTEGLRTVSQRGTKSSRVAGSRATLLVVADGSARRTEKAPGHLDPRAAAADDAIVDAIRNSVDGGLGRLLHLDPELCAELLVAGRAPLQVLASALGARSPLTPTPASADVAVVATTSADARVGEPEGERTAYRVARLEVSDPFGVLYVVAHLAMITAG